MAPGHQAVQAALAVAGYAIRHPLKFILWYWRSRNLIILSVPTTFELFRVYGIAYDDRHGDPFMQLEDGECIPAQLDGADKYYSRMLRRYTAVAMDDTYGKSLKQFHLALRQPASSTE
jgi:hypothetical protein